MELDVWWPVPKTLQQWNKALSRLRSIARHETQHLGQDMLQAVKRLDQEAGLPSRHIQDPRYSPGGIKQNRSSIRTGSRREHALRDVEFYTRIGDDVDSFMMAVEDLPKENQTPTGIRNLFKEYLRGGRHSSFFAHLRKAWQEHQAKADKRKTKKAKAKAQDLADRYHRRYKKAVIEFLRGIQERGIDPLK